jgi:hypothetical protein
MKIHPVLLPPLVIAAFFATVLGGQAWELPTMQHEFSTADAEGQQVEMIVDGLRCRGTSNFFVARLQEIPGLLGVTTYVQEHRAAIQYDPEAITVEGIREAIEEPVFLPDGRMVWPFKVAEILE